MPECKEYPKAFIEECKQLYPDNEEFHKLLEEGSMRVGGILDEDVSLTPAMIVSSFEISMNEKEIEKLPDTLKGLYERAKKQEKLDYLFGWFLELISN
jgi:hypothetical protein